MKYVFLFVTFGVLSVAALSVMQAVKDNSEKHNDHLNLDKKEKDEWYELVSKYYKQ